MGEKITLFAFCLAVIITIRKLILENLDENGNFRGSGYIKNLSKLKKKKKKEEDDEKVQDDVI